MLSVSAPLLILFLGFFHPTQALNQDLGRHILTGNIILSLFSVPPINLYSYTYPLFPFINHHWLPEVIFAMLFSLGGVKAIYIICIGIIISASCIIFLTAKKASSWIVLSLSSLLYLGILFERTDLRPELFSFLFLSLFVYILYQYRENYTRLIFLLIPLEILWVNSHIYFPLGVLVTTLFFLDICFTERKNLKQKKVVMLFSAVFLVLLATLCNPQGLTGALYPFHVFQNYGYTIEENQNPFFLQSLGFSKASLPFLEASVIILFLSLLLTFKKSRLIDWLLAGTFTVIAFLAVRNFPLFVFATLPGFTRSLTILSAVLIKTLSEKQKRIGKYIIFSLIAIASISMLTSLSQRAPFTYGVKEDGKNAVAYFQKNNLPGKIFNNFDIGSYLAFKLYPETKVFIDGRPEAYPASFIKDTYIPMQENPELFTKEAKKYRFQTIIFSHTDQTPWAEKFVWLITRDPAWTMVFLDAKMMILVKNEEKNIPLLEKLKPFDLINPINVSNESDLSSLGHFYSITQDKENLLLVLQKLLLIKPYHCAYLRAILSITDQNTPIQSLYLKRFQGSCN